MSNYRTLFPSPRGAHVISRSPHGLLTYTYNLVGKLQAPVRHHGFPLSNVSAALLQPLLTVLVVRTQNDCAHRASSPCASVPRPQGTCVWPGSAQSCGERSHFCAIVCHPSPQEIILLARVHCVSTTRCLSQLLALISWVIEFQRQSYSWSWGRMTCYPFLSPLLLS